ncbi:hypothetical protein [Edaphobacter dinghuensis]|uniref:Ig-like domain-containing protein n=1 Tax=Edaphobacter dinghuensis TaxID=1560005 RepID=A0A917LWS5_9BACT|nr:hypothetical protein [Edaphobacter dinghuensis]GGG64036.1 hypothetical protein GCM10011585_02030 [Edaphobacter dinghuensis]
MNRRFGPSLLFVNILALLLMPAACWSAPQAAADATYAKKIEAMLPPKVECVASSTTVTAGQIVTLTARVQGVSAGLQYSFSSSGGRLYPDGPVARLDTKGVAVGSTISATCQVTNGAGRRGAGNVVVHVVAMQTVTAEEHASVPESAEVAAKNGLGGSGGSPQGGAAIHASHKHVVQTSPATAEQAQSEAIEGSVSVGGLAGGVTAPSAASTAAAPPPSSASGGDPYQAAEARAQWVKALKNGKIEYNIPGQMELHETSVVTVVIHGFADTSQNILPGATTGTLKVSPYMRMQLTADNPDEFEIDPKVGAVLPVPIDSSAKWTWNVVPKQPAKSQTLTIEAFLVYSENGDNPQELLPSYVATVNVSVPGFWESAREEFWNNPSAAIKYVLPGGAGFTVAAGLIVWWWKRRHPEESKQKKEE